MRAMILAWSIVLAGWLLCACGGVVAGDPATGQKLFSGEISIAGGSVPTCAECHAVTPDAESLIGPGLSNIGNRAASTVEGMTAAEYLRTSIVDPDAYLAGGFQEGIHYRGYREVLTAQQLSDLIAYMLTLKSGSDP